MYPAPSLRFLTALREPHTPVTTVHLHWPDGAVTEVPHIGGSVRVDRGQAIRRTCSITISDPALIPATAADYLAISGAWIRPRRGIAYPDGTIETVPVGAFRLESIDGDPDAGPVTLTGRSPEAALADAAFTAPYSTRSSTAAITSITAIIRSVLPAAVVVAAAPDTPLGPRTWDAGDDRLTAVTELATAVGCEVWADADGVWHIEPLPDLLTAPVAWDVDAGEGGVLISAATGWSRAGMYNIVVASGENTESGTAPVTATVMDDDPTSPTYYLGPFGQVPYFYSSPTLTSTGLATGAALALLRQSTKPVATADLTSMPNPLLEAGDVLRARYDSGRRDLHQVQAYTLGLGLGDPTVIEMIGGRQDA